MGAYSYGVEGELTMNTAVKPHVLQAVDWNKYSAAQWLEQYGAWVWSVKEAPDLGYPQQLARAIDQAKKKKPKNKAPIIVVEITDDEARAVLRILCSMLASAREMVNKWAWVLILRYESAWDWPSISGSMGTTVHQVRELEKEGLAYFLGCIQGHAE